MTRPEPAANTRARAGFTLIEIIAVVAIMAMVFAIGIPQLGGRNFDELDGEAASIAESLRFARQRAIMTGIPHRVLIDLEEGGYLIEWYVTEERAFEAVSGGGGFGAGLFAGAEGELPTDDGPAIDLLPPRVSERDYYPIPNRQMGEFHWLDDALYFVGVEGASGWTEGGDYPIVFHADGTTESALLEIADAEDHHLTLEIEPLLERVHVREGGARS